MTIEEKQFQLGDVVFGLDCPVELKEDGWQIGAVALRTSDADQVAGDGVRMGRDYKGASTWSFSLYTNAASEAEAWAMAADLAAVWDGDEVRDTSGEVMALRYTIAGQTRRVYGRPRRWTPVPSNTNMGGRIDIQCDFELTDHLVYDDDLQSVTIPIGVALELDAGLLVPFIPPFISDAGATVKESAVRIGGSVPTPINVTFNGPVEQAAVVVGDWTAAIPDPVEPGNPVTIDARPWVRAATMQSGGGVRISPRITRISKMVLPPGNHAVSFSGVDPTSSASVMISWRNARRTPR